MGIITKVFRFTIRPKRSGGPQAFARGEDARALGLTKVRAVQRSDLYFVRGELAPRELDLLGRFLFCDQVVETFGWEACGDPRRAVLQGGASSEPTNRIEVALRPGVTDSVAEEIMRAAAEIGIAGIEAVSTGEIFDVEGEGLERRDLELLADRLLANPVIQRYAIGRIEPAFPLLAAGSGQVEHFPVALMSDEALESLSAERRTALDIREMTAIRDYFRMEGRECTDVELETIAQTWSEHCGHKSFKALIDVIVPEGTVNPYPPQVDNILKSYIKKATDEIAAPWVLSAFVDNAGILVFDDEYEMSFKVETHNHPSAVEPFGGANTGVGGVIRDVMGVSARPIAATDVLCFGPVDMDPDELPSGVLHPRRVFSGVVAGVQDYGNKMGIPTVNGGIHFDPGYTANPLVFCGCAGLAPRGRHRRDARPGDRVVVIGGKTGRDGIRGATFSSMVMDSTTGEVAGASVQIGAPIVEKKASEIIVEARDKGLYTAITDCGAGGLSSAVGEMAAELGCDVDVSRAPLKYPGLAPWEIWLSEAQERMVLAIPPEHMDEFAAICGMNDVGVTDLGRFTGDGRLVVRYGEKVAADLDCRFLHDGIPQRRLVASPPKAARKAADVSAKAAAPDAAAALLGLLAHPAIASKEAVVRLYDHEVQGATVVRPFTGILCDGPSDASVIKPRETGGAKGIVLSNGINPKYGKLDAYRMALSAVDEAVRNAVSAGADPDRIAILDNFCWGDPKRPETMWTLLEAARGCHDAALAHGTPFVSGKDSFNNEYYAKDGTRVSIPPTLLISAIGIVPDVGTPPGTDLKAAGDPLFLAGDFRPVFGGSVYGELFGPQEGWPKGETVPDAAQRAHEVYGAIHKAILAGCVASCHDLSEGGLAVAVAEMCLGGRLGARLEGDGSDRIEAAFFFGETNGCLVLEVKVEREEEFLELMDGLPVKRIGGTAGSGILELAAESGVVSARIEDIAAAFRRVL
ncbi:MAG: phosphoribosylformylglycinamidine synthase subunit PurL [Rectinemataceae bacterium]|jgi:phosphoribosylformylglycinamidine synthase